MNFPEKPEDNSARDPELAATQLQPPDSSASALVNVLDQYLADLQAGKQPDRAALLAAHPELASQLEDCLSGLEFVHRTSHSPDATPSELGDFRIIREVGRGGMGVVYEAEQRSLKRRVALKVLRFGGVADAEAVMRFQREAETIAGLDHGHIVPVYAVGAEGGVHYYSMQFIDGRSLADVASGVGRPDQAKRSSGSVKGEEQTQLQSPEDRRFASRSGLPLTAPAQIAEWGLSAAQALSYAHRHGVVHRDVKPSNLILDNDGRLWLTDFGLARRDIDATLSIAGALLGTPRYMSPEQAAAAKKPVDHRTDIYSLGATLYELATGQPVFDADTPQGVITQILNDLPRSPRNLDPDLPRDLETIILKCLQKEAADRYATAADLADDLQAFLDDRPIRARRPTLIERGVQALRRHRRIATAAAASALSGVLLVVGSLLASHEWSESKLGTVSFTTSGPRMIGEIVDANDRPVISGIPVPTLEKVRLPEGEYRLRLSADGLLSEIWPLEVQRGKHESHEVALRSSWLWPPKEINPSAWTHIEPVALSPDGSQSASLFVQNFERETTNGPYQTRLQLLDGRTGKSAWPQDLLLNASTVPDGTTIADQWASLLSNPGILSDDMRRRVPQLEDLNGDGTRDLVLLSRNRPSLLAVSGADGSVLWWYRARPPLPNGEPDQPGKWGGHASGTVLGFPTLADVDQDGTADVVTCFLSAGEAFYPEQGDAVNSGRQCWIEAVSGRTGERLWTRQLEAKFDHALNSSDAAKTAHTGCHLAVLTVNEQRLVAAVAEQKLVTLNLTTGDLVRQPYDLGFDPPQPPVYRDLDGDGSTDVLLIRLQQNEDIEFVSLNLRTGAHPPRWSKTFRPKYHDNHYQDQRADWLAVDDLDGDSTVEIVTATGNFADATQDGLMSSDRWCGVEVINAATGETRWQRRLSESGMYVPPEVDRVTTGPDLDGDGHREVFAALLPNDNYRDYGRVIRVVALSGRTGETLWRWHHPVSGTRYSSDRTGPLAWWQPGPDGWPLLVVPQASAIGGQDTTFILSASTGRLEYTLSEVAEPQVADFNGDGLLDLFYRVAPQGAPRMIVMAGAPAEPWKRLGHWRPVADLDGDGSRDFLKNFSHVAASGRENHLLWQSDGAFDNDIETLSPPTPFGDLNGDGAADIVGLWQGPNNYQSRGFKTLSAISGRTGESLWNGMNFGLTGSWGGSGSGRGWSYRWPACDWTDLDNDDCAEFLIGHMKSVAEPLDPRVDVSSRSETHQPYLSVISGRDGSLKWQTPVVLGSVLSWPDPYDRTYADLNGDGVGDIVVWAPAEKQKIVPRAISGRDGAILWTADGMETKEGDWLWPRPAVGDLDGDGINEVIVGRHHNQSGPDRNAAGLDLVALNGRDGTPKWSHTRNAFMSTLPPLLVDLDGDGQRAVCLIVQERNGYVAVILNPRGDVREQFPINRTRSLDFATPLWNHADLDGDGREELLYPEENRLIASHGRESDQLWSRELAEHDAVLLVAHNDSNRVYADDGIRSPTAEQRPESERLKRLMLWSGTTVYGLDPKTGESIWRCDDGARPSYGSSDPVELEVLSEAADGIPQQIVFDSRRNSSNWLTVSRAVQRLDKDGRLQIAAPAPRTYEPLGEEPVPLQPLPWMSSHEPGLYRHIEGLAIPSGLVSFALFLVPWWLTRRCLKPESGGSRNDRSNRVRIAPVPAILLACYAAALALSSVTRLPSALALIAPVLLWFRTLRRRCRPDGWLIVTTLLVMAPLILLHVLSDRTLAAIHSWRRWWWVDETVLESVLVGFVSLPGLFFWWVVLTAIRQRDGQRLWRLFGLATVLAIALALLVLTLNSRLFEYAQYDWSGLYVAWFWGAYGTGLLAAAGAGLKWCRQRRDRKTTSPLNAASAQV
ncbi:protein kinase [bacterium]|nr:protein kinase [bacterium]